MCACYVDGSPESGPEEIPREESPSLPPGASRGISIAEALSSLARALEAEAARTRGGGVEGLRDALAELPAEDRERLQAAFSATSRLRRDILDVLVDACGNQVEPPAGPGGGGRDLRVTDEDLVQLTARLFRQFVSVEQAVVEIVFDLLGEGMVRNQLPGHVGNLRGYTSQLIHQGSSDAVEKIQDYLGDINLWIVAILAAGVRVSQQWWSDWWEVIQPRAIEERVLKDQREGGIAAKLFGSKLQDSWKKYRELARDLHPAEIKGQLQRRLGELTRREFEKQKGGPIPPVS